MDGNGEAHWDDQRVPIEPGSTLCYPPGVTRRIVNSGDSLLTYICHAADLTTD
jgi:mannose-6-phosphate isomerase-like protein (cupin superfamily)